MLDTYSYESVSPAFKVFHFPVFYNISFCKMLANNRAKSIDGLQSRDETAMLVDKIIANYGWYFA